MSLLFKTERNNVVLKEYAINEICNINNLYSSNDIFNKYHNSQHIFDMLQKLNKSFLSYLTDDELSPFIVAVIYHDSVYVADANFDFNQKNEDLSVNKFMGSECIEHLTANEIMYITELIQSTKITNTNYNYHTPALKVMHDLDYSGFGETDTFKYLSKQADILEECITLYSYMDASIIIKNRINFLKSLLQDGNIFKLPVYSNTLAINNIKEELKIISR